MKTLLVTVALLSVTATHARKPNIVLIMADDMGYAGLSCTGNKAFRTPHLDQLISDNGGTGENKSTGDRLRGRKGSIWEGGHRVPGIAWWPGTIKAGAVSDETVMGMDLMPTMMALGGGRVPDGHSLDGIDLSELLLGGKPLPRRQLFWALQGGRATAVRDGPWKLVVSGKKPGALYHLGTDLKEGHDRAAEQPALAARLRASLDAWHKEVRSSATVQPPPPGGSGRSKF